MKEKKRNLSEKRNCTKFLNNDKNNTNLTNNSVINLTSNFININNNIDKNNNKTKNFCSLVKIEEKVKFFFSEKNFFKKSSERKDISNHIFDFNRLEKLFNFFEELSKSEKEFFTIFNKIQEGIKLILNEMAEKMIFIQNKLISKENLIENCKILKKELINVEKRENELKKINLEMKKDNEILANFINCLSKKDKNSSDNKNLLCLIQENEKLKNLALKQKRNLNDCANKEIKIMKLLYEIRKKGVDIESIYNNEVKTPESNVSLRNKEPEEESFSEKKGLSIENKIKDDFSSSSFLDCDKKEEFLFEQRKEKNNINNWNFKLNLNNVNNNNENNNDNKEVFGFHQEFMSKINEFSKSWRDLVMKEKNF